MLERNNFETEMAPATNGCERQRPSLEQAVQREGDNKPLRMVWLAAPRQGSRRWREWLEQLRRSARAKIAAWVLAGTGLGLAAGLVIGWIIWPVEWTNVPYAWLEPQRQTAVIETLTDLYAYNQNSNAIMRVAGEWPQAAGLACQLAAQESDPIRTIQYIGLAHRLNGRGCE